MKKCANCKVRSIACPFTKLPEPTQDSCPLFTSTLMYCALCGLPIIGNATFDIVEDATYPLCANCAHQAGCSICVHTDCHFQTDATCPEPPIVMTQERHGNTILQRQIPNLKRIEACCPGCSCYNSETKSCNRETDYCANFQINYRRSPT